MRLDHALAARGLTESRELAKRLVYAGKVRVNDQVCLKPSTMVAEDANLSIENEKRFVSRGGDKLEHALTVFKPEVAGKICADIGASTGGFTDCLLGHGAKKVYAVDVGKGQLHWKLRNDSRVSLMEGVNARYLQKQDFRENIEFACVDVSFISLQKILPAVKNVLVENSDIVALIKPQFEAGRRQVGRGGVVRDENIRREVVETIKNFGTTELGLLFRGLCESPVKGPAGNVEYLICWKKL